MRTCPKKGDVFKPAPNFFLFFFSVAFEEANGLPPPTDIHTINGLRGKLSVNPPPVQQ